MRTTYVEEMRGRMLAGVSLAEKLGASAVKISFSHDESRSCNFEAGRLKYSGSDESVGYSIQVVKDGRRGGASGNIPEELDGMVRRAVELAQVGADAYFSAYPKPGVYADIKGHSDSVIKLTSEKMIEDCQEIVDYLKSIDDTMDISASASKSEGESIVVNNAGLCESDTATAWSLGAGIQKTVGTDMLFSGARRNWMEVNHLYDKDYIKQTIARDLEWASRLAVIPDGEYPVILPPRMMGLFLVPILGGMNGRAVYKGTSPLKDKLGQQIASPNLTIEDNPFMDFNPSSAAFDGAGLPTRRRYLVKDGILQLFLYDLDTAGLVGVEPTGGGGGPVSPCVFPGTIRESDMIKSVKRGLYIKQLLGFGQGNLANGDFSANVALGFVIENGEIVGRVKNAMVAGNILDLIKGEILLSSDVDDQSRQPTMLMPGVSVVSAK